MDIWGGANSSIAFVKRGVWGAQPPEAVGYLILFSTKIPIMQDWSVIYKIFSVN